MIILVCFTNTYSWRVFTPDKEIDEKSEGKNNAGIEDRGQKGSFFPLAAFHGFVQSASIVATHQSHEFVEEDGCGQQSPSRCWWEHTKHGKEDGYRHHAKYLYSWANDGGEKSTIGGRPKDIPMHKFPSSLFNALLQILIGVVLGNVPEDIFIKDMLQNNNQV